MITVISGTNRRGSRTRVIAELYKNILCENTEEEVRFLSLEDLPNDVIHVDMYEEKHQSKALASLQDSFFTPAEKLVFIVPEYNGSFPGVFKLFIDAISVRNYKENFAGKKVCLIGVASGRAGNLRGLDHLTTSLNYLKMNIYPNRFPIAKVNDVIDSNDELVNDQLKLELTALSKDFIAF